MPKGFLGPFQKEALKEIGKSGLSQYFIWSGGTALSYFYLRHRISQDLDFFSQDLVPDDYLLIQIKQIVKSLKIKNIEEQKRFNRHQFWLKKDNKILKVEFVFYPFPYIKKPKLLSEFGIKIASLEDIFTNKAHAIFERSEPKDILDFYLILQRKRIDFFTTFKWVRKKFGVEIDPVIFVSRILKGAKEIKKIQPLLVKKVNLKKVEEYFEKKAHQYLRKKIKKN